MTLLTATSRLIVATLLALAYLLPRIASAEPSVLRPEQAFRYEAKAEGAEIIVRWHIEPGYYLYRERMSFGTRTPGVELGAAQMPDGLPYHDEFFGDMHIYRDEAVVRIPVVRPGDGHVALEVRSQGCADIGLCYPPQTWITTVALPQEPPSANRRTLASELATGSANAPLPPEKAFRVSAGIANPTLLRVTWEIAPGYYLYRDSLKVESTSPGVTFGAPQLPAGTPKEDEHFGQTRVFYDEVTAEVPVSGRTDLLQARVSYQGCKENSICYPPQTVVLTIDTDVATVPTPPDTVSEQDEFASRMASGSLPFVMLLSFLAGLAMSLLPCCWPMIPILSGIIVGQGNAITTGRAFALSATYVLGMAVVYAAAGAVAAAAGQQVQSAMQTPWIIGGVALIFVAMALSMFGLYELQLPAALTNRFNAASERQRTGTWIGTALMGALSALVVSACVAPPLVGVLTFIAQTGDVLRGAMALFSMAIGMGVPLLVLGASGGRLLPKAGPWMENVKAAFGFVMLGLAIWMLDRILSDRMTMLLWAALLFGAGIYLGAFRRLAPAAAPTRKLARGVGLLAIIYGVALLAGAYSGSGNPLQPLGFLSRGHSTGETAALPFRRIKTLADLDGAIAAATADGKPVMLDFYADWCTSCIEMEHYTFNTPQVRAALDGVVLLQADVTANDTDDRALLNRFGIFGPPTIVFFGVDGQERQGSRIVGYQDADRFAAHVRQATGP